MTRTLALVALLSASLPACGLFGPSRECEPDQTRPCSCPGVEGNGRQTCGPEGTYGDCDCPELDRPSERVELPQRSPEELARVALTSALSSILSACALAQAQGDAPDLARWFHPSVSEGGRAQACRIDDQGVDVYRRPCAEGVLLCADAAPATVEGVEGECWQFTANPEVGASRVVGCQTDEGFRLVVHEGFEALRAPPRPEPEDDFE